jgi:peptide/nickel transport system permease protein
VNNVTVQAKNPALPKSQTIENLGRNWYKFSRNPMSIVGLGTVLLVVFLAVFAPWVAPYPKHAGKFVDFANASLPPCRRYLFGTDTIGRDILSRIFFGFRFSLTMGVVVLAVVVPIGVPLGLIAGYNKGTWLDTVIMRSSLSIPPRRLEPASSTLSSERFFPTVSRPSSPR